MNPPPAPTFHQFFQSVHGYGPFPWQSALAERVLEHGWPPTIDAPTGLGKTSVIDVALYVLARQAALPAAERTAHTRILLVVDRRLIVDSACAHAEKIHAALTGAADAPTQWARDALCALGGTSDPFVVRRMRGGLTWSSLWSESTCHPVVLTATVDQFGSRYLFRGYGTSSWIKPVDAGLLGTDSLVLLDEAHLSSALVETVVGCQRVEGRAVDAPLPHRRTTLVSMTATPVERTSELVASADREHPHAGPRLTAEKRTFLLDAPWAASPSKAAADAGLALAGAARQCLRDGARTVLVTANTVAAARAAFAQLGDKLDCALVIGRTRSIDRDVQLAHWFERTRTGRSRANFEPFVLVATQTVEVGVDIDVDALVTELAPIDSLVQRFGRVDRRGELGSTVSYVVRVPSRLRDDPPPYGPACAATWEWLTGHASVGEISAKGAVATGDRALDMGTMAVGDLLQFTDRRSTLLAPVGQPPVVLSTAVEVWRRTSPIPSPDETIHGYLHGVGGGEPTVSIAWRCDLDETAASLTDRPPMSHELVEVPLAAARRFVSRRDPVDLSDLESAAFDDTSDLRGSGEIEFGLVRRSDRWEKLAILRPGDVIVLPTSVGGHDQWGFTGESGNTTDVAELDGSARFLRLDPGPLSKLLGRTLTDDESELRSSIGAADIDRDERRERAKRLCALLAENLDQDCRYAEPVLALLTRMATADRVTVDLPLAADDGTIPSRGWLLRRLGTDAVDRSDDDDRSSDGASPVRLADHLVSVGDRAADYATRCGVQPELVNALRIAGRFHDLGKADVRFQAMLASEPEWMVEGVGSDASLMLAKSSHGAPTARNQVRVWPVGMRHEAVSLALVAEAPADAFAGVDRELVEHLVASHHGRARPLFPAVDEVSPRSVAVDFDGISFEASTAGSHPSWSQPSRFQRLCDRYGSWGLAYLEATLRIADISISKEGR